MGFRKGQITVYMIIGIIALVSVSIFFYIRSAVVEAPQSYAPTIEQIPFEAEPIRNFVSSCVSQVAENGLKSLGDHGGYPNEDAISGSFNAFDPTSGSIMQFSPGSSLKIPFWWHLESPNNCDESGKCSFSSKRPNLLRAQKGTNIEEELDKYMNRNLRTCLREFAGLQEYGFAISEAGEIETRTVVTKNSVAFHVKYPLVAQKAGTTYKVNEYFVDIPLRLEEIYNLAATLTNLEIDYQYLERFIISLIDLHSAVDQNRLPPFSDTQLDTSGGVRWMKSDVKEKLSGIVAAYIPMLQVANTRNYNPILFPESDPRNKIKTILYNNMMLIPLIDESHTSLSVNFVYLDWWKPYFDLNCGSEICKPQELSGVGQIMFFLQRYSFLYDYSIPILVDITDPDAYYGKGYSFKFFIEANIRDNKPLNTTGIGKLIEAGEFVSERTMLCDENKRNSPEATIIVTDSFSGSGVEGAAISYACGRETCTIGVTGTDGKLVSSLPVCAGGYITAARAGYLNFGGGLSTSEKSEPFNLELQINPIRKKDFEIKKYQVKKMPVNTSGGGISWKWVPQTSSVSISSTQEAIASLERIPAPGEPEFSAIVEYAGNRNLEDGSKGISILPGNYNIDIRLVTRANIAIPKDRRCEDTDPLGLTETCVDIQRVEFTPIKPLYSGGLELQNVRISSIDLDTSDVVVLHAVEIDIPGAPENRRVIEDLDEVTNIASYSQIYRELCQPQYKTYSQQQARTNQTFILT